MDSFLEENEEEQFEDDSDFIVFHSEDIDFKINDPESITRWIEKSAEAEGKAIATLNFIFCSDEFLYKMNMEYLHHDTYTDVITFPYSSPDDNYIEGDIFISVDRTRDNAKKYNVTEEKELFRVIIHGVLHLLGFDDKTEEKKKIMTEKEDQYLKNFFK